MSAELYGNKDGLNEIKIIVENNKEDNMTFMLFNKLRVIVLGDKIRHSRAKE